MSEDAVSLIKHNVTVSQVVGRYIKLERRGNRFLGLCPIHGEKTPSFNVDDAKGFFHCFGCGRGGDVIKFIQEIENVSFPEALDLLAEIAGIELPKRRGRGPSRDVIEALREVYREAGDFYVKNLASDKRAMDYLAQRGLNANTIRLFKLGLSGNAWEGLHNHLSGRFEDNLLMQSGLFKTARTGKVYDLFRDRIMFPIHDAFGNIIAFGGRLIEGDGPKYINSPDSPLFHKGRQLYNLNFAKPFLKRDPQVIVVEGYMDVVQVYQAGLGGIVAGLGTAFTPEQAKLLKRYAERVVLNFDGDAAGFKAARATIETFLRLDVDTRIVSLPNKLDPDDFIKEHGLEAYKEQINGAQDFFDFLVAYIGQGDLQDPRVQSHVTREMCRTIDCIQDQIVRERYIEKLAQTLSLRENVIREVLRNQEQNSPRPPQPEPRRAPTPRPQQRGFVFTKIEANFLYQIMHHEDYLSILTEEQRKALPQLVQQIFADRPWVQTFIFEGEGMGLEERLQFVPKEHHQLMYRISLEDGFEQDDQERLRDLFSDLLKTMINKILRRNRARLQQLGNDALEEKQNIMRQNMQLQRELHKL